MGTWYLGPKGAENVYAVLDDKMKCDPIGCDDLGRDEWVEFLKSEGRWTDLAGPHEDGYIFFDGGGMICTTDPKVSWEANGCKMKTWVTHLPFLIHQFEGQKISEELRKDLIMFRGFHRIYAISQKTRDEALPVMRRLLKGTESLRQEREIALQKTVNATKGRAFSFRKCGCLSGEMYIKCCGKFVTT